MFLYELGDMKARVPALLDAQSRTCVRVDEFFDGGEDGESPKNSAMPCLSPVTHMDRDRDRYR